MRRWPTGLAVITGAQVNEPDKRYQHRPLWRVTLRSAPLLEAVLLNRWHQQVHVFRWKFLAKIAARQLRRETRGILTECTVEPYRTGENVVKLKPKRSDRSGGSPAIDDG